MSRRPCAPALIAACLVPALIGAADPPPARADSLGLVLTEKQWAIWQTADGKQECPNGINPAPLEQFRSLFQATSGKLPALEDSQMRLEIGAWYPDLLADAVPFREAVGAIAPGLDLDGRTGPADFTGPDGTAGVDNQLARVFGCVAAFRGPLGRYYALSAVRQLNARRGRMLIEVAGLDDLVNDPDVTVTLYHGRDPILTDASRLKAVAGGTQSVDDSWTGDHYRFRLRGRIEAGILTTEPADVNIPPDVGHGFDQLIHGMQLRLKLRPDGAEGMLAGYADIDHIFRSLRGHSAYFRQSTSLTLSSVYRALQRLADAAPDPATGRNTAISAALSVTFVQAMIAHPPRVGIAGPRDPSTGEPLPAPAN